MKMLTVSLFVCAMMALTRAAALPKAGDEPRPEEIIVEPHTDADSWTEIPITEENHMGGWSPSCPDGWTMFDFRLCLLYVPKKMTWAEAEKNCQSNFLAMPGNLVPVLNPGSSHEINELMRRAGHKNGQIWVGGCDTKDPSWDWSTYGWSSVNREHVCLQRTAGENVSGCLKEMRCDAHLPSVCSLTIM